MRLQILQYQLQRLNKVQVKNSWDALRVRVLTERIADEINWYQRSFNIWRGIVNNN